MSDGPSKTIQFRVPRRRRRADKPPRPKLKWLRLTFVATGLGVLALISTAFGMLMAVASDLPKLEDAAQYQRAQATTLVDDRGRSLGVLTDPHNRVLVPSAEIAPVIKQAIIAVEDKRFYSNDGFDLRGTIRAAASDVVGGGGTQGGSTITEQFIKNALDAQGHRTVFEKLREAALAFHLTHRWTKDKILTEYLNSIYFGNGAYGIESAARTYFGKHSYPGCGQTKADPACAGDLDPAQAALLAGIVASPSAYDPGDNPIAAEQRRDLVLREMLAQGDIPRSEYRRALREALPVANDITPPQIVSKAPYFTSWVAQQVIDRFGANQAFNGGLTIKTTLDLDLQRAAENAISSQLSGPGLPSASLVAIDNKTGQVRALVGGSSYATHPFNLATQGERQPGSAFKPFVLAKALEQGISPDRVYASRKKIFPDPQGHDKFVVTNFGNEYSGQSTLANALTVSDNSVFAEVGIDVGIAKIARLLHRSGIRTPLSHNLALPLGGIRTGVTPLDMAHAYETLVRHGSLVSGSILGDQRGPVGIESVKQGHKVLAVDQPRYHRVIPPKIADEVVNIMKTVITSGTAKAAAIPGFAAGKTGTTTNESDAWFVGFNSHLTVAVWVGFPNRLVSMAHLFHGGPVTGGTYPALIWRNFMLAALALFSQRTGKPIVPYSPPQSVPLPVTPIPQAPIQTVPTPTAPTTPVPPTPVPPAPQTTPTPTPTPAPTPAPAPPPQATTPSPSGGGGTSGGGGGGTAGGPRD